MISIDTNILFPGVDTEHSHHRSASRFLEEISESSEVIISEFFLLELYGLLRNPAAIRKPLSASAAVDICESIRRHPHWQIVGFPAHSRNFHDKMWPVLRAPQFARRRAYDWRTALSLIHHGVTDFATVNLKDFQGFGFKRVWNPLS